MLGSWAPRLLLGRRRNVARKASQVHRKCAIECGETAEFVRGTNSNESELVQLSKLRARYCAVTEEVYDAAACGNSQCLEHRRGKTPASDHQSGASSAETGSAGDAGS